jgi:hypothetical protein
MNRRNWTEKLKENAPVAFELALRLGQDQEFRERLASALEHGREAARRARGRGIVGAARRLATDRAVREELQHAGRDLQEAYDLLNAKRSGDHHLRRITPVAGLASLAAVPQVRERVSALIATAARNRQQLLDFATAVAGSGNGGPSTLDALTKEELYARAQEAEIPGRSEMSKDELVAALRAKS